MDNQDSLLNPVELPTITDVVYERLRRHILRGHVSPGKQLNLVELEKQLEVSRTPLKTALVRLQNEGLVVIHPRRGTFVKRFDAVDIHECFEVRIALEAHALHNAFEPDNNKSVDRIVDLLYEMDAYFKQETAWLDELIEFMDKDRQLHIWMIELSGNQRIKHMYEQVNLQGYIAVMGSHYIYSDTLETQNEHHGIREAFQSRDLTRLLNTAREHLLQAKRRALLRLAGKDASDG